jgi:putative ATP-binding cassette transporter
MSGKRENVRHQEWSRFWENAFGLWRGWSAWRIWLVSTLLFAVVSLQLYVQFRLNYWNRDFFDALEGRNPARLQTQALLLVVALAVTSVWGRMTMQRKWREWPDQGSDRLLGRQGPIFPSSAGSR